MALPGLLIWFWLVWTIVRKCAEWRRGPARLLHPRDSSAVLRVLPLTPRGACSAARLSVTMNWPTQESLMRQHRGTDSQAPLTCFMSGPHACKLSHARTSTYST